MGPVAQIKRDRDERVDLSVGRGGLRVAGNRRVVVTQDLVPGEHRAGKTLRHGAVCRIVLKAVRQHHVERAVAVLVLAGDQEPLLGLHQPDGRLKDQGAHVPAVPQHPVRRLHPLDLTAQLAAPFPLGLPGLSEAPKQLHFLLLLALKPAHVTLEPLPIVALPVARL